jgi:myo-inositol-1(or 4)-monophosphatase
MAELTEAERRDILATAEAVADAARVETLRHFRRRDLGAENKSATHFDPVTVADRASEAAMRRVLAQRRPADGILGEEQDATPGTSGLTWVLDPIDGTRGYLAGTPVWGVLIALCDASGPLYGIIDQPYIGERFSGGFGRAAMTGPQGAATLATSTRTRLDEAILFTTFPGLGTPVEGDAFSRVAPRCRLTRYGMDCYAYALLAGGHVDLVIEAGLKAYDICAPIAVIEAAGGVVTDWQGGKVHQGGRVVAAANADLHAAVLALLDGTPG